MIKSEARLTGILVATVGGPWLCSGMILRFFLVLVAVGMAVSDCAAEALDVRPIKRWMAQQGAVRTLSADFVQTRSFRALKSPLANKGRMWLSAPGKMRWELGDPAKAIALKTEEGFFLIEPAKRRAEKFSGDQLEKQSGMRGMAMMEFPMARDFAEFERTFEVLSLTSAGDRCDVALLPRDQQARKMMKRIALAFRPATGELIEFEMEFKDGSKLRNEFLNVQTNGKIDPAVFDYDFTGYKVRDGKN